MSPGPAATRQLFRIRQGQRPVSDYAIEFRTLAASAGWGERELHGAYYNGLSDRLLDKLSTCDLPVSLEGLVELTLRIDARLADRRASRHPRDPDRSREGSSTRSKAPPRAVEVPKTEPMQVGRTKLSMGERQRRRVMRLSARVSWGGTQLQVPVLLDSGSDARP